MRFLIATLLLATVATGVQADNVKDEFSDIAINTIKVSDNVHMLTGKGGNIAVFVGEDGIFMIDDQFAPLTRKIKAAIKEISDQPIRFVINTHWHFDHTGGNENLGKADVVIVAHENVRKRMSKDNFIKAFNKKIPAAPKAALPVIIFNDHVSLYLNEQEIQVEHRSNAHTDGDSIIIFKSENVIHMGDIFFNTMYPFIDESSDGSIKGIIDTVNYVLKMVDDETKIIPGHGPLGGKASLENYLDMLVTVRDRMQSLIDRGKSIEQIIELKPFADLDKEWGNGFLKTDDFLKILYGVMIK